MNIYVGNIAQDVSEEELTNLFAEHGKVSSAKILRDMFTQESRGFGFVEMSSDAEAQAAIDALNEQEHSGRRLMVNEARPREERGGGYRDRR